MTHNLNSTVFVYRHRETGAIRALYTEDARAMTGRDDYEHVASLEPRMWIEHHFDDAAKERQPLTDEQVPVAWRMRNTAYRGTHYEYYTSKEAAESRQTDFNRSVDDGSLLELTPLYTAPPKQKDEQSEELPIPRTGARRSDGSSGESMTKQVEATLTSNRGKVYRQIAAVFDSLPDRFTATELYKAAKLESAHAMQRRMLIASVLSEDFKCVCVRSDGGRGRHWKKPGATHDKR